MKVRSTSSTSITTSTFIFDATITDVAAGVYRRCVVDVGVVIDDGTTADVNRLSQRSSRRHETDLARADEVAKDRRQIIVLSGVVAVDARLPPSGGAVVVIAGAGASVSPQVVSSSTTTTTPTAG